MRLLLHPSDQPIFRLAVRIAQARLEVRVNDVPVLRHLEGQSLFFELPVNQWLFQGRNDIDFHLSQVEPGAGFGKHAFFECALQFKIAKDAQRNQLEVGMIRWQPEQGGGASPHYDDHHHAAPLPPQDDEEDAPLLALPGQDEECQWRHLPVRKMNNGEVRLVTALSLPPPWPTCPWQRADYLSGDTGAQFSIERMTRTFHDGLRYGGWEELVKLRRAAIQSAYYLTEAEADEALGFSRLTRDAEWALLPLPEKGLELEIAGHGRLARLIEGRTRESPLMFLNEKESVSAEIGAWWMFGGQWTMIR